MARRGLNIYKRKDGRWEGRYIREHINGHTHYGYVYAHTYKEAKDKLDSAKQDLDVKTVDDHTGSIADIGQQWIEEIATDHKRSTIVKYEDIIRNYICPVFGDSELSSITNNHLMVFVAKLRSRTGKSDTGLSSSTISEIITVMNSLRLYALKHGIAVAYTTDCLTLRRERQEIRVFSIYEERQLAEYLYSNQGLTAIGIIIALYTGIRLGELCALTWDDIDMKNRILRISKTMIRLRVDGSEAGDHKTEILITDVKSATSRRTIPIPKKLMKVLRRYYIAGAFVLTGQPDKYVEPRTMENRFKSILKACDIETVKFHTLRHTFATRCIELGFDMKTLSEILGHSNISITMNRYVHPTMEYKAANMEKLSDLMLPD